MSLIRNIYSGTRSLLGAVKDANRARQIAVIVGRHGFAQLLEAHQVSREQKAALRDEVLSGEDAVEGRGVDVGARLVNMIEELGPTFIKFGQVLSSRPDLLPAKYGARMESLQDRVSPIDSATIRRLVIDNLGAAPEVIFARFDEQPIASASIGQVHGALTHEGQEVVVKVQRPGLRALFEADLSLLRFLVAQALEIFPEADALDPGTMILELEANLLRETDFGNELQALNRFGKNFSANPHVHIPKPFPALSTACVLTMERIVGSKLTAIDDAETRRKTALIYLDAAYQMVFRDGLFHGDLHPGNVFLEADGKLGLIDFGMVGRISRQRRDQLVDIIFALTNGDVEGVAREWYRICRPAAHVDFASLEATVFDLLETHVLDREMHEIQLSVLLRDLVAASSRLSVRVPGDFLMLFKAMATTEGLAKQIAEGINPIESARPYIKSLMAERYSATRLRQVALTEASRLIDLGRDLPFVAERLLGRLERGEARLQLSDEGRDEQLLRLARAGNRIAVALLSGAAAVTGALAMGPSAQAGSISIVAFAVALAGAGWLAVGLLRGD